MLKVNDNLCNQNDESFRTDFKQIVEFFKQKRDDRELLVEKHYCGVPVSELTQSQLCLPQPLSYVNLSGTVIKDMKIVDISFEMCNMTNVQFIDCEFSNVYFKNCDLTYSTFRNCNFTSVQFLYVSLNFATIECCEFNSCKFMGSMLSAVFNDVRFLSTSFRNLFVHGAKFRKLYAQQCDVCAVNFGFCMFRSANVESMKFVKCSFEGVDVSNTCTLKKCEYWECTGIANALPEGEIIVYKVLKGAKIAKLKLFADSKRVKTFSNKCRTDKCVVLDIYSIYNHEQHFESANNAFHCNGTVLEYTVGKVVHAHDFDSNRFNTCTCGIHFFVTEQEAVAYYQNNF